MSFLLHCEFVQGGDSGQELPWKMCPSCPSQGLPWQAGQMSLSWPICSGEGFSPSSSESSGGFLGHSLLWHWNSFSWGIRPAGCGTKTSSLFSVYSAGGDWLARQVDRKQHGPGNGGSNMGLGREGVSVRGTGLRFWEPGWHKGKGTSNGIQQNWVQILLYYIIAVWLGS